MTSKETVEVRVDVHEPPPVVGEVADHDEVEDFILDEIESGDIVINNVAFERKTPTDFASSMTSTDDRLRRQVEVLSETYDAAYVLLDGDMQDFEYMTHTNVPPHACRGFAARITATYDVPVIPCSDTETLVDMAVRIARKHIEDTSTQLRVESSVDTSAPVGLRMWGVLPGIGETRAEALYDAFGSPTEFVDELARDAQFGTSQDFIDRLIKVDGIGEDTAEQIVDQIKDTEIVKP